MLWQRDRVGVNDWFGGIPDERFDLGLECWRVRHRDCLPAKSIAEVAEFKYLGRYLLVFSIQWRGKMGR